MGVYFVGLKDSTATNASIFDNAEIVFALMIAIIVFRERLTKNELVPFFMIIFGVMVMPIAYDVFHSGMVMNELLYGDILIIVSGLFLAIDVNLYKFVNSKISSHRIMQLYSFSGALMVLGIIFVFDIPIEINLEQMVPITLVSILGVGLPTMFFLIAIRLIGPVKTILVYSTTSIFGLGFAALILGEEFSYVHVMSTTIVIVGIYMLRKRLAGGEEDESKKPHGIESKIELHSISIINTEKLFGTTPDKGVDTIVNAVQKKIQPTISAPFYHIKLISDTIT